MHWSEYEKRFRTAVRHAPSSRQFDSEYVERCLRYARRLHSQSLPVVFDQTHFSLLVGYRRSFLLGASNAPTRYYRTFQIPKASGGLREISEPLPSLKEVQRWILDEILARVPVHTHAKGFIRGRSIRDNARFHRGQPMVLSVDIEDFFGSIRASQVMALFRRIGYSRSVSTLLTGLCTKDGVLPQGAPTSPALSNVISIRIDRRLASFCRQRRIRYTRYADDLTFSGDFSAGEVIRFVRHVLGDSGLRLNEDKTRLMRRHERQEATGIVVNTKLQAPRETRRAIRQATYFIAKYGLGDHLLRTGNTHANYIRHLLGRVNFALFVNPADEQMRAARDALRALLSEHESVPGAAR